MIIDNIKIRNFKSFGNNVNELELDKEGNLILISGANGSGKTSILDAIDYVLFNKVRGKNKKTVPLSKLVNRINKNLAVELEFTSGKHHIHVVRKHEPSEFKLTIDGVPYDKAGKANKQEKLEEMIGMDLNTFKSFISMTINDFKNFMTLSPEEKRMLLDRLFNLEIINQLSKILKEKRNQQKHQKELFESEVNSYQRSIDEFNESIKQIKETNQKNLDNEIESLNEQLKNQKPQYDELKEKLSKFDEKEKTLKQNIQNNQERLSEVKYQIKDYENKLEVYNSGTCPTCGSQLSDDTHKAYKKELEETIEKLKETKEELENDYDQNQKRQEKLNSMRKESESSFADLKSYLKGLKDQINELKNEKENGENDDSVNQLLESIEKIEKDKEESQKKLDELEEQEEAFNQLSQVFSENGVKKHIISKIVKPINHFIKENLEKLEMGFNVELDEQFNANIHLYGEEIDVETLSTGETKKVNIAIMLAYLKMIRMRKHINILFLDEVFASIDIENVGSILYLIRDFAKEYNTNVFLVHHALLEQSYFDRILKIQKNITSNIIEE